MPQPSKHWFKRVARSILKDGELDPIDRKHLKLWVDAPVGDPIWTTVRKRLLPSLAEVPELTVEYFIQNVLAIRRSAEAIEEWPEYLKHAKQAESLARFLRGQESQILPPPMPEIPNFIALADSLDMAARAMRERARAVASRYSTVVSQKRRQGNAKRRLFMRTMSHLMTEYCGRPLDSEVAALTNILFPGADVTEESVRGARRPTKAKDRLRAS